MVTALTVAKIPSLAIAPPHPSSSNLQAPKIYAVASSHEEFAALARGYGSSYQQLLHARGPLTIKASNQAQALFADGGAASLKAADQLVAAMFAAEGESLIGASDLGRSRRPAEWYAAGAPGLPSEKREQILRPDKSFIASEYTTLPRLLALYSAHADKKAPSGDVADPYGEALLGHQRHDPRAAKVFFNLAHRRLVRLFRSWGVRREDAKDLAQVTMYRVLLQARSGRWQLQPGRTWTFVVIAAKYRLKDLFRRCAREAELFVSDPDPDAPPHEPAAEEPAPPVHDLLAALEELRGWSPMSQRVLVLYYLRDLTQEEIAAELRISRRQVAHYRDRGLELLLPRLAGDPVSLEILRARAAPRPFERV